MKHLICTDIKIMDRIIDLKLKESILVIEQLLAKNNLGDWGIKINNNRVVLATTRYNKKTIFYSKHFLMIANYQQIESVTLHEVAHALLGPGEGHNSKFIKMCAKISSNALYACPAVNIPIGRYIVTCPECGYNGYYNDARSKYCKHCFESYGKKNKFDIKINKTKVLPL